MFKVTIECDHCIHSLHWNVPKMAWISKEEYLGTMADLGWEFAHDVLCPECAEISKGVLAIQTGKNETENA